MNTIKTIQNESCQLDRLAAKTLIYGQAKRIFAIQIVLSAVVSSATALLAINFPDQPHLRSWAAVWGIGFTLTDLFWLTPLLKNRKKTAATIQEMFDCDVLQLPWKRGRSRVDAEDVINAARRYKKRVGDAAFDEEFTDWYRGELETLPLEMARLICQRANFRWDVDLRRKFTGAISGLLGALVISLLAYGFARNLLMLQWLTAALLPLQPVIILCARLIQENHEAIAALNKLKADTEKTWQEALQGAPTHGLDAEALTLKARDIQDEAWEQRTKKPLIFEWVYKLQKESSNETMNIGTAALVKDAQKALQTTPTP